MNRKESNTDYSIIFINGFFLLCFMLLVLFGTSIYRHIYQTQQDNNGSRSLSSYLLTISRMNEAAIYAEDIDGRQVLIIEDGDTGYGNRIYLYEGSLIEDYGRLEGRLSPSSGVRIAESDLFVIEEAADNLLKITTSAGSVFIHTLKEGGQ